MTKTTQFFTVQEFLQLPDTNDSPRWELLNQVPHQKPRHAFYHSRLQKRLVSAIDRATDTYEAFPELRCILRESSVISDISIVERDRVP